LEVPVSKMERHALTVSIIASNYYSNISLKT